MKYLILILLFISNTVYLSAQYRYADLRVEFTTPEANTIVKSPGILLFQFKIINQGPDSLYPDDSLRYLPSHNISKKEKIHYRRMIVNKIVPPNDSFYINDSIPLDGKEDSDLSLFFGSAPVCFGFQENKPLWGEFWEDVEKDNMPILNLIHKMKNSNTEYLISKSSDIIVYPNPLLNSDLLTIEGENIKGLRLIDMFGRDISIQMTKVTSSKLTLLYKGEISGIYILLIETSNGILSKKIITE